MRIMDETSSALPHLRPIHLTDGFLTGHKLFNHVSMNLKEGLFRCTDRRLVSFNPAFMKMFGYTKAGELINTNLSELFQHASAFKDLLFHLDHDGAVFNRDVELKGRDGYLFSGSLSLIKVVSSKGILHYDGALRDITLEKRTAERAEKQAQAQQLLIDISTTYINTKSTEMNVVVTKALQKMGEWLSVDRVNVHYYDFNRNECVITQEWNKRGVKKMMGVREMVLLDSIMDFVSLHQKGEYVFVSDIAALPPGVPKKILETFKIKSIMTVPMNVEGNCVGFVGFDSVAQKRTYTEDEIAMLRLFANMTANITSKAVRERKLNALVEQTSIQNRRLREFSFITSHNIRSAASNLMVLTDFISQDPTNLKYIRMLQSSVTKLDHSIKDANDLLDMENTFELNELKKYNVSASVTKVLKWHKNMITQKDVHVQNKLPSSLKVMAIPNYVDNIFNQLIANAIKFGVNEKSKKIFIDYSTFKDEITVRIRDFGSGIDLKRNGERLFQVGGRFHADSCDSMGMGLFLAKFQIEALGGRIILNSEINHGTSVEVIFKKHG